MKQRTAKERVTTLEARSWTPNPVKELIRQLRKFGCKDETILLLTERVMSVFDSGEQECFLSKVRVIEGTLAAERLPIFFDKMSSGPVGIKPDILYELIDSWNFRRFLNCETGRRWKDYEEDVSKNTESLCIDGCACNPQTIKRLLTATNVFQFRSRVIDLIELLGAKGVSFILDRLVELPERRFEEILSDDEKFRTFRKQWIGSERFALADFFQSTISEYGSPVPSSQTLLGIATLRDIQEDSGYSRDIRNRILRRYDNRLQAKQDLEEVHFMEDYPLFLSFKKLGIDRSDALRIIRLLDEGVNYQEELQHHRREQEAAYEKRVQEYEVNPPAERYDDYADYGPYAESIYMEKYWTLDVAPPTLDKRTGEVEQRIVFIADACTNDDKRDHARRRIFENPKLLLDDVPALGLEEEIGKLTISPSQVQTHMDHRVEKIEEGLRTLRKAAEKKKSGYTPGNFHRLLRECGFSVDTKNTVSNHPSVQWNGEYVRSSDPENPRQVSVPKDTSGTEIAPGTANGIIKICIAFLEDKQKRYTTS